MFKLVIVSIVILFGCLFAFQQIDPTIVNSENNVSSNESESQSEGKVSVTIEGEIKIPGIYKMYVTETLYDLIEKSGGLTEYADQTSINLSCNIDNRTYFYIPKIASEAECIPQPAIVKVNINKASKEELATINYISLTTASKIVEYRNTNGPFMALEDIMNVSGIGQATYEKIRDYITLS